MILYLHPQTEIGLFLIDLVAQLVEHLPFKERVLGSSPSQVTRESKTRLYGGFYFVGYQSLLQNIRKICYIKR